MRRSLWLALLCLASCTTEPAGPAARASSAQQPLEAPRYFEPVTHLRFPVPSKALTVEVKHYDESLPAKKFKHSIQLVGADGVELLIDVWNNTEGLALEPWFEKYLSFLVDGETRPSQRKITRAQLPGIVLVQPQSPQALSMAVAVFAHGSQIFRVTCIDYDGIALPESRAHFFQVLEQLEVGVEQ